MQEDDARRQSNHRLRRRFLGDGAAGSRSAIRWFLVPGAADFRYSCAPCFCSNCAHRWSSIDIAYVSGLC